MSQPTILLIDYDPGSVERTMRCMRDAGYEVHVARDGVTGLDAYHKLNPDLVLLEAMIPKKHGFEVCREIKQSEHGKRTLVVIMTGIYRGRRYRDDALREFGCDEYVEKPIADERLLEICNELLASRDGQTAEVPGGIATATVEQPRRTGVTTEVPDAIRNLTEEEIVARLDALIDDSLGTLDLGGSGPDGTGPREAAPEAGVDIEFIAGPEPAEAGAPVEPPPCETAPDSGVTPQSAAMPDPEPYAMPDPEAATPETGPFPYEMPQPETAMPDADPSSYEVPQPEPATTHGMTSAPIPEPTGADRRASEPHWIGPGAIEPKFENPLDDLERTGDGETAAPNPAPFDEPVLQLARPDEIARQESSRGRGTGVSRVFGAAALVAIAASAGYFGLRGRIPGWLPNVDPQAPIRAAARTGPPTDVPVKIDPGQLSLTPVASSIPEYLAASAEPIAAEPETGESIRDEPLFDELVTRPPVTEQSTEQSSIAESPVDEPVAVADETLYPIVASSNSDPGWVEASDTTTVDGAPATTAEDVDGSRDSLPEVETPSQYDPVDVGSTLPDAPVLRGTLVALAEVDTPPVAASQPSPLYPSLARSLGQRGTVTLDLLIDDLGRIEQVELVEGIPRSVLNDAAATAVRNWIYEPATKDGVPVKVWKRVSIEFK